MNSIHSPVGSHHVSTAKMGKIWTADKEQVWRVYSICITTGDTSKTNRTQALLKQGAVCLHAASFFRATVYLWQSMAFWKIGCGQMCIHCEYVNKYATCVCMCVCPRVQESSRVECVFFRVHCCPSVCECVSGVYKTSGVGVCSCVYSAQPEIVTELRKQFTVNKSLSLQQ